MSKTIKAIERHMILKPRRRAVENRDRKFVAEWQPGAEIWGHAQHKLRLTFAAAS